MGRKECEFVRFDEWKWFGIFNTVRNLGKIYFYFLCFRGKSHRQRRKFAPSAKRNACPVRKKRFSFVQFWSTTIPLEFRTKVRKWKNSKKGRNSFFPRNFPSFASISIFRNFNFSIWGRKNLIFWWQPNLWGHISKTTGPNWMKLCHDMVHNVSF